MKQHLPLWNFKSFKVASRHPKRRYTAKKMALRQHATPHVMMLAGQRMCCRFNRLLVYASPYFTKEMVKKGLEMLAHLFNAKIWFSLESLRLQDWLATKWFYLKKRCATKDTQDSMNTTHCCCAFLRSYYSTIVMSYILTYLIGMFWVVFNL